MPEKFQIIEVPDISFPELEQMGTKFKFWYYDGFVAKAVFVAIVLKVVSKILVANLIPSSIY